MDADDLFDLLPDPVLLLILNKVWDLKDLGRCSMVSKRFYELAFQVDSVSVKFNNEVVADGKLKRLMTNLRRIVFDSLLKPFKGLNLFRNKRATNKKGSEHLISEALKNFKHIRHLQIELSSGELVFGHDVLLKWRAEFGSTVENCVILGASCLVTNKGSEKVGTSKSRFRMLQNRMEHMPPVLPDESEDPSVHDVNNNMQENLYTDMEMRLSVLWTISSLVAATARHYLFQKVISHHPLLESLVIVDATGQGTLSMSKPQLQNYRSSLLAGSTSFVRRSVPSLKIRLWHAPYLQLSDGMALKGATLAAIDPEQDSHQGGDDFIAGAFEEPFNSATSRLIKSRTYLLEMQSI